MTSFIVNYTSPKVNGLAYAVSGNTNDKQYFYEFKYPLRISQHQHFKMRIQYASISSYMPNIITNENNTIRYSLNGGTTWSTITMEIGKYSVDQLNSAINSVLNTYYTDTSQPAFKLKVNTALYKVYIVIDSSKLNIPGAQLQIDMSVSTFYDTIGFSLANAIITNDGLYTATNNAKIDNYGSCANVYLGGISSSLAYYNGSQSSWACRIPFTGTDVNEYIYINNSSSYVPVQLPAEFFGIYINVKSNDGNDIRIFDGSFSIIIEFTEY